MAALNNLSRDTSQGHFNIALDETDFPSSFGISKEESEFLEAVKQGDMHVVKECVDNRLVDVHCMDGNGETPVQIAVKEGVLNILSFLLCRKDDIFIGQALLDAITKESLESVIILVEYDKQQKETGTQPAERKRKVSGGTEASGYSSFIISPLVLAAQTGNYEITKFLMTQGYTIEDPHPKFCSCKKCVLSGRLGCYLSHLNTYRALASPVYIALKFLLTPPNHRKNDVDPFYRALVLKKQLMEYAESEYEFREDYMNLAKECEDFAVLLLDRCRNLEEISVSMAMPGMKGVTGVEVRGGSSQQKKLSVLNFAIKYRNKKFIAHRYSQVMLNTELYNGSRGLLEKNEVISVFLVFMYWLVMPICMILYQFLPSCFLTTLFDVPVIKYLSHMGSSIWFLVLLFLAAFQDKLPNTKVLEISYIDVLVGLYVIGIFVEEVKQVSRQGKERYASQWWHIVTLAVASFFLVAGCLWISAYAMIADKKDALSSSVGFLLEKTNVTPRKLVLLSNSFYAVSLVLTFFQVSHYFQVSYLLGPLHMSMMSMVGDLMKFFALFSLNYISFAIGIRKLYSQYVQTATDVVSSRKANNTLSLSAAKTEFKSIESSFRHLFWGLFGLTDPSVFETIDGFEITQVTGEIMFAAYVMAALLVCFNVLIAMLTNTFKKIAEDQDISFKVARTRILMQYVNEGSVSPPPFNLIPVKAACAFIYKMFCADKRQLPDLASIEYNEKKVCLFAANGRNDHTHQRNLVIKWLIQRYFAERDKKREENLKA